MLTAKSKYYRIVCAVVVFLFCFIFGSVLSADSYELSLEDFIWRVNGQNEVIIHSLTMLRGVTEVYIPEQIDNKPVVGIDSYAFSEYERLERIYLPKTITSIEQDVFTNTRFLKEIIVAEDNESFVSKDGVLYTKDMSELCKVPTRYEGELILPDTITEIRADALLDAILLESIYLPKNAYPSTDGYYLRFYSMFAYAPNLKTILVSDEHKDYMSKDGALYSKDGKILYAVPPAFDTDTFTVPDSVEQLVSFTFGRCSNIKEIIIPKSVTYIEDGSIFGCGLLEQVVFKEGVRELCGKVFVMCDALRRVYIPNNIHYFEPEMFDEYSEVSVIYYDDPSEIKAIEQPDVRVEQEPEVIEHEQEVIGIPKSKLLVKQPVRSGKTDKFTYDVIDKVSVVITGLTEDADLKGRELIIPLEIDGLPVHGIARSAFVRRPIECVILQEGIQEIGYGAFYGCNLKKLVIPSTVSCIETLAFKGNLGLEQITVDEKNPVYCSDNGVLYTKDKKVLVQVPENYRVESFDVPDGVEIILEYAFAGNRWIEYISLPQDIREIYKKAFGNMLSLKENTERKTQNVP